MFWVCFGHIYGVEMRLVLKSIFCAVFLCGLPTVSAAQGLWDMLFGGNPKQIEVACELRDRVCLLDTAVELAVLRYVNREVKSNWHPHAHEGQRLLSMAASRADRERYLDIYHEVEAVDEFYEILRRNYDPDASWITPGLVRKDFSERHSSIKGDFEHYAGYALETLMKRGSEETMGIWWTHLDMLSEVSVRGLAVGYDWLLLNDIEGLNRFHKSYRPPNSSLYDLYEVMAYAAARYCQAGNMADGNTALGLLETELKRQLAGTNLDLGHYVIDYAPTVEPVLYCRGEAAALVRLDEVMALTDRALNHAKIFYIEEDERGFVSSVIRSEVGEGSTVPFALWLHRQGREEEAARILARMPYFGSSTTIGGMVENGILSLEANKTRLEEVVSFYWGMELYSENPTVVLIWFMRDFNEAHLAECCNQKQKMEYVLDAAAKIWPKPQAVDAAKRALLFLNILQSTDNLALHERHWFEIRHAQVEKEKSGCAVSDEKLRGWLDAINSYPSLVKRAYGKSAYPGDWHQSMVLEQYLGYIAATPNGTGGPCLIQ